MAFWRFWVVQSCRLFWEASVLPCFETNVSEWGNAAKCQQFSGSGELLDPEVLGGTWLPTGSGCMGDADLADCPQKQSSRAMERPQELPCTVTSVTSCWSHRASAGHYPFQPILWWINQVSSTAISQKGHHKQFSKNCADITRNFI